MVNINLFTLKPLIVSFTVTRNTATPMSRTNRVIMENYEILRELSNVIEKHKMRKHCWKNFSNRLAQ